MRSQKGKILSWIVFAVIILIFFGILVYMQSKKVPQQPTPTTTKDVTVDIKVQPRKTFAVPKISEKEKENKDTEAFNKAITSGKGCEEIKYDEKLKQTCLDTLNYNSAIQKNDEKLCEKISDSSLKAKCIDQVYFSLGTKDFDLTLCKKIKDSTLKQNCMDQIQVILGRTASSASSCDVIKDAVLRQSCLDNFYFSNSIQKLSKESCDNIKDIALKDRCTKTIAKNVEIIEVVKMQAVKSYATSEEKLKACDLLTGSGASACKDEANFKLAYEKKDLSYCNSISDSSSKSKCIQTQSQSINTYYLRQAISKNDSSLCSKILDKSLQQICLTNIQ